MSTYIDISGASEQAMHGLATSRGGHGGWKRHVTVLHHMAPTKGSEHHVHNTQLDSNATYAAAAKGSTPGMIAPNMKLDIASTIRWLRAARHSCVWCVYVCVYDTSEWNG